MKRNKKLLLIIVAIFFICLNSSSVIAAEVMFAPISLTDELINQIAKIKEEIEDKPLEPIEEEIVEPILEEIDVCGIDTYTKSYEDGKAINDIYSNQYALLQTMYVNEMGIYETNDGYLATALGSFYGPIGSKYILTLDSGIELSVIKADEKADKDTIDGCYHKTDGSMIEFIIDEVKAIDYFGFPKNGYVLNGNFNNAPEFNGSVISMKRVIE